MNIPYVMKQCPKCGQWLVASTVNFNKHKTGKYGLQSYCKDCVKVYKQENKERLQAYRRHYRQDNRERINAYQRQYHKEYQQTPKGQVLNYNSYCRRRAKEETQGNGINKEQWLDMMRFFNHKCAYSGIDLNDDNRSIDHIVPLNNEGLNEIYNLVPALKKYNQSKQAKEMEDWYRQQPYFSEERLSKIHEWQEYAYKKYAVK